MHLPCGQQTEYNGQDRPLNQYDPGGVLNHNTYQSFIPHIEIPLIDQAKAKTMFPILKTSAKSVQTTRVVCTNYG